jgi:uncharacterized membrane protein
MSTGEYVLVVALYADVQEAAADLRDVTAPESLGDAVVGSGILQRDWRRGMLQQGGGGTLAYGVGTGAAGGIVAGVFLGVPLIGGLVGAVVGGFLGWRVSRREVDGLISLLGDAIPVGATALLIVVEESRLLETRTALGRALRTSGRVLDDGPLTRYVRAFVRGNPEALEALDRQAGRSDEP